MYSTTRTTTTRWQCDVRTDGQESTLASRRAGRRYDMPGSVIRQRTHSIIHRLQSTALWSPSVRNHWQQTYCCRLDNRITHDVTAHIYSWGLATVAVWVNNLNAIQRPYETEYALHYLTCHRRFAFKFRLADIRRKKACVITIIRSSISIYTVTQKTGTFGPLLFCNIFSVCWPI